MSSPGAAEEAAVSALIATVEQYVRDNTPPGEDEAQLPEGIRLEIHPGVRHLIMRYWAPDYREFASGTEPDPFKRTNIPVVITPLLPKYTWRLVVVTEDVITSGGMPYPGKDTG